MIRRAIVELNEVKGSSEEVISRFIEKENKDLPWAHVTLLKHHLRKLCWDGEIMCTNDGKYMLQPDDGDFGQNCGMPKMRLDEDGYDCSDPVLLLERTDQTAEQNCSETLPSLRRRTSREQKQLKKSLAKAKRNLKSLELKKQDDDQSMVAISSSSVTSPILGYACSLHPLKVMKHDINQPMRREEKKNQEDWQKQTETICGEVKSIVRVVDKQKQPEEQGGKTVGQQQEHQVDVQTKRLESSFDRQCDQNSKVSFCKCSVPLLEKAKKSLKWQHKRKNNCEEKKLIIVCGLMAGQSSKSSTYCCEKAPKSHREPMSASLALSQELVRPTKSACGEVRSVLKIIHKEKQPEEQEGKTVGEQYQQQQGEMGGITKILGSPFGGDCGENLKESLFRNGLHESKHHEGEEELITVCDLLAEQQSEVTAFGHKKAMKSCREPLPASLELSGELGQLNEPHIKLSSPKSCPELEATSLERFTQNQQKPLKVYMRRGMDNAPLKVETPLNMSSKLEHLEGMQQLEFRRSENPLEFELRTLEEDAEGGQEEAVSHLATAKASQKEPLGMQKPIKVYFRRNVHMPDKNTRNIP
ncbi:hypothetical protein SLEP1_g11098 [Rubroshorea leprosula]|uniref:H15 domain-containing protein n=1 Tax=Rubroshorea leprosula TaxID=152421 RepID=A0AAV5II54_9ROSI|nr:hypothetical protein SLEP1_g11098 [Rubroshorea leprosula]